MTARSPEPDGDTIAGDPRLIDVESSFEHDPDDAEDRRPSLTERLRASFERSGDEVIGGVSVDISSALGLDALWVRIAFVVLALVGGLGIFLYGGLWLALIVGADRRWARIAGGVIVIGLVPWFISSVRPTLATGTGAVLILLVGLTLALWNRSSVDAAASHRAPPPLVTDPDATVENPVIHVAGQSDSRKRNRATRVRERPPASPLGRAAFGAAVVVAASGALIDELNGGRLHPEQWLGAAAVMCGFGLLVGAIRGHARWLIVPAALFAVVGYVAGESAGLGLTLADVGGGDRYHYIFEDNGGVSDASLHTVFSSSVVDIPEAPSEPAAVEVRSAFGNLNVSAGKDVTIELIGRADNGEIDINGRFVGNGTHLIGPGSDPDVVIDARTLHGEIMVFTYDPGQEFVEEFDPMVTTVVPGANDQIIGEGVRMLADGTAVLLDGQGVIGSDNQPLIGDWYTEDESRMEWSTEVGTWQLVRGILITPFGQVLDLDALRAGTKSETAEALLDEANTPVTTAAPSTIAPSTIAPSTTIAPQEG